MNRAELLALAARCEAMVHIGMNLGDHITLLDDFAAAERATGPLPNDLIECAAALRARAEEARE